MAEPFADTAYESFRETLEQLYMWLVSKPAVLFQEHDRQRMLGPILHLKQTSDWLGESSLLKTEWFLGEGSGMMRERLTKGDYDLYE